MTRLKDGDVLQLYINDEFFSEKSEVEICKKALEKLQRIGKKEEKIYAALERLGFNNRVIREIL